MEDVDDADFRKSQFMKVEKKKYEKYIYSLD